MIDVLLALLVAIVVAVTAFFLLRPNEGNLEEHDPEN